MKWLDTEWDEDLIWCPSQLTRNLEFDGVKAQAYLRWRWDDPWQASVIFEGKTEKYSHWVDIWEMPQFKDTMYKQAEKRLEEYLENPANGWAILARYYDQIEKEKTR